MDYVYQPHLINNDEIRKTQINLIEDNEDSEIIPKYFSYSSIYDSSYGPENLFTENG